MRNYTLTLLFILLITIHVPLRGSDNLVLSLNDCIKIALKNNSQLKISERNVDLSVMDKMIARAYLLPTISTSFGSGKYIQGERVLQTDVPVGINPETGQMIYEQKQIIQDRVERNSHSASISLYQNIFDFGRSIYSIKQANAMNRAAESSLLSTRQSVILNVKTNYYNLLKAMKLQKVYEDAVELSEAQVKRVESMVEVGSASKAEWYQARVSFGENLRNLITQKNMVSMARADLNNALGRNPNTPFEIQEDAGEAIHPDYDFETAVETALKNNPEIKSALQELRATSYGIRVAQSRYLPNIGVQARYSRNNDDIGRVYSPELNRDFSVTMGIGLDLNIFNGFADHAAVQKADLNSQIAQERFAESQRVLIATVKQHFLSLQALKDIIEINQENLEAAEENLRLQQERRRVGAGTELEVSEAQVRVTEAQSTLVRAEYDSKIVKAQLEATMGIISE